MKKGFAAFLLSVQVSLVIYALSSAPTAETGQALESGKKHFFIRPPCPEIDWASWDNFGGRNATGKISSQGAAISITLNSNFEFDSAPEMTRYEAFKRYKAPIPNAIVPHTSWSKGPGGTTTVCFSQSVKEPILLIASLGSYKDRVQTMLKFSEPYVLMYNAGGVIAEDYFTLTGREGYALIKFPGDIKCVTISSNSNQDFSEFSWGIPVCPDGTPKPAVPKPTPPELPAEPPLASVSKPQPVPEKPASTHTGAEGVKDLSKLGPAKGTESVAATALSAQAAVSKENTKQESKPSSTAVVVPAKESAAQSKQELSKKEEPVLLANATNPPAQRVVPQAKGNDSAPDRSRAELSKAAGARASDNLEAQTSETGRPTKALDSSRMKSGQPILAPAQGSKSISKTSPPEVPDKSPDARATSSGTAVRQTTADGAPSTPMVAKIEPLATNEGKSETTNEGIADASRQAAQSMNATASAKAVMAAKPDMTNPDMKAPDGSKSALRSSSATKSAQATEQVNTGKPGNPKQSVNSSPARLNASTKTEVEKPMRDQKGSAVSVSQSAALAASVSASKPTSTVSQEKLRPTENAPQTPKSSTGLTEPGSGGRAGIAAESTLSAQAKARPASVQLSGGTSSVAEPAKATTLVASGASTKSVSRASVTALKASASSNNESKSLSEMQKAGLANGADKQNVSADKRSLNQPSANRNTKGDQSASATMQVLETKQAKAPGTTGTPTMAAANTVNKIARSDHSRNVATEIPGAAEASRTTALAPKPVATTGSGKQNKAGSGGAVSARNQSVNSAVQNAAAEKVVQSSAPVSKPESKLVQAPPKSMFVASQKPAKQPNTNPSISKDVPPAGRLKIEVWDYDGMDYDSISLKLNGIPIGPKVILLSLQKRYGSPEYTYQLNLKSDQNTLEIFSEGEGVKPGTTVAINIMYADKPKKLYFTLKAKESVVITL
jgi:hypothetical protein